jgi:diaminopimelate decarboxylase
MNFPNSEVSVKINPGFGSGLVRKLTSGGVDSSFGIWFEEKENIKKLLEKYNLKLMRLHTHIGSERNPLIVIDCLDKMLEFSNYFGGVEVINLGGGYRVKSLKTDIFVNHVEILELARNKIAEHFNKFGVQIKLELEPGTFILANAGSIITSVIDIVDTGKDGNKFIKINSGLTEIIRPSYYGANHPLVIVKKNESTTKCFQNTMWRGIVA